MEDRDALPVTALLASEPRVPVVVYDSNAALRMAVVDRQSVYGLDEAWDTTATIRARYLRRHDHLMSTAVQVCSGPTACSTFDFARRRDGAWVCHHARHELVDATASTAGGVLRSARARGS